VTHTFQKADVIQKREREREKLTKQFTLSTSYEDEFSDRGSKTGLFESITQISLSLWSFSDEEDQPQHSDSSSSFDSSSLFSNDYIIVHTHTHTHTHTHDTSRWQE